MSAGHRTKPAGKILPLATATVAKHLLLYSALPAGQLMLPGSTGKQAVTYELHDPPSLFPMPISLKKYARVRFAQVFRPDVQISS